MSLKLIGMALVSVIGFAQTPMPAADPVDLWRTIRSALMSPAGDRFFQQIRDCQIPPEHQRFSGTVVSQTSPNELVVNVDNAVGDAVLRLRIAVKKTLTAGAPVHFEGVVRPYSRSPCRLTVEVLPEDIEGLY